MFSLYNYSFLPLKHQKKCLPFKSFGRHFAYYSFEMLNETAINLAFEVVWLGFYSVSMFYDMYEWRMGDWSVGFYG